VTPAGKTLTLHHIFQLLRLNFKTSELASDNRCDGSHHLGLNILSSSQVDWESNGGLVKKLPSIREDEEGDEEQSSVSRAPRSPLHLSRGLSSPLRSPLLPPRPFRAPSEHMRPSTLQIPVVSFSSAPPELSPR